VLFFPECRAMLAQAFLLFRRELFETLLALR